MRESKFGKQIELWEKLYEKEKKKHNDVIDIDVLKWIDLFWNKTGYVIKKGE